MGKTSGTTWFAIASAPKDGTEIMVYCEDTGWMGFAKWDTWTGNDWGWIATDCCSASVHPTQWQPKPMLPADEEFMREKLKGIAP